MEQITSFGYWVRRQRKALDLTQTMLAERVGCALITVKKIERDERRPSRDMAGVLADHLAIADADRDKFIKMGRGQWVDVVAVPDGPVGQLAAPSPIPHNLPPQPTSFIGREAELNELNGQLTDPDKRLVTILGPGGIGKTRLSLAAAEAQRANDQFSDGIYFVSLASVYERTMLVVAIADTIGFSTSYSSEPEQTLLNQLGDRRMLIVLDNFEQLRAEADLIERILVAAPGVKLLISSRERLTIRHEWAIDLHGLPIPNDEAIADGAAAQLFVQRAQRVRAEFELAGNETAVTRICHLVDGMPLGLELAANWIRVMKATEIASEVERSIDFLATGQLDLPDRHRSIRAVFQSTWAQLSPAERQIFSGLSIFRNGITFDAAKAVTGATPITLLSLIDQSLLTRNSSGRYMIHELLRQFGQTELAAMAERKIQTRAAHADYFAALLEWLNPDLYTDAQLKAGRLIEDDFENILLAWRWFVENGDGDGLYRMMDSLHEYCDRSGRCQAGAEIFHQARQSILSKSGSEEIRLGLRGALSMYEGLLRRRIGVVDQQSWDDIQLLLADPILHPVHLSNIFSQVALAQYYLGRLETAEHLFNEAMKVATEHANDWALGIVLSERAHVDEFQGDYRRAEANFESSIDAFEKVGDQIKLAYSLNNLGRAAYAMGNYAKAEEVIRAALKIRRRFQDVVGIAYSLLDLAKLYRMLGKYDEAEVYLTEGATLCEQSGLADTLARYHNGWGMLEQVRGRPDVAIDFHKRAQRFYQNEAIHAHLPQTLNSLAAAEMAIGASERAEALLLHSLDMAQTLGNLFDHAMALALLGRMRVAQDQLEEAGILFGEALLFASRSGATPLALQILCSVAQLLIRNEIDQPDKATMLWRYTAQHPATEADIRREAEACLTEFEGGPAVRDLTGHDIWDVVANLHTGLVATPWP